MNATWHEWVVKCPKCEGEMNTITVEFSALGQVRITGNCEGDGMTAWNFFDLQEVIARCHVTDLQGQVFLLEAPKAVQ